MMLQRGLAVLTVTALALSACGGGGGGGDKKHAGELSWVGKPHVYMAKHLPSDRVVIADVRNTGSTTLHLIGTKVVVIDATGRRLKASAAFTHWFAHGLYGALEQPAGGPPAQELERLGKVIYLPAGGTAPFYAAWRLDKRAKEPVRIDYGAGSLEVPKATATTH